MLCREKLIVALDSPDYDKIISLVETIGDDVFCFKVGMQCFYLFGEKIIREIKKRGHKVFLDLKIHDIPNTASEAVKSLSDLEVDFLTYHLSGGEHMIEQMKKAQENFAPQLRLLGVSYLTSLSMDYIHKIYGDYKIQDLFKLASDYKTDIVCAANDISQQLPHSSYFCPGIRMNQDKSHDQKRVVTPSKALDHGADFIIMGRSITESRSPSQIIKQINKEINK